MGATLTAGRRVLAAVQVLHNLTPGATPSPEQRDILAQFPGWGPASTLFDPQPTRAWAQLADTLDELAGADVTTAARLVDTSFYTPASLVAHIYRLLMSAGFTGGPVLDLGCGNGRFLHHAPDELPIAYTGVDADPIAAGIAAALHPRATIIAEKLQQVSLPDNHFAAAVGNVPFGNDAVHDQALGYYGSLHGYFILRAVRAVRPGGYVVVATSRHTIDSKDGLPHAVTARADLMAAIRLPSGYFPGTDVLSDVVVLRVRAEHEDPVGVEVRGAGITWVTEPGAQPGEPAARAQVSAFWDQHPDLVAGTMRPTGFYQSPLAVEADNPTNQVAAAFTAAQPMLLPYPTAASPAEVFADVVLADADGRKSGSYHLVDGTAVQVIDGALQPVTRPGKELVALIELRDLACDLLAAEADWDRPDHHITLLRQACLAAYTDYVERFGALNRGTTTTGKVDPETGEPKLGWKTPTMGGFRRDPDSGLVFSLEVYDQATGDAEPAPILTRRVNRRPIPATHADNPGEALAISVGEGRGLDLDRIAELLALPVPDAAFTALGDLAYRDPVDGTPQAARDYLSGNVRAKLRDAQAAAANDPAFARNVAALQGVQPRWLGREEIRIELGSPWVTTGDIEDFCKEVFGATYVTVKYIPPLADWEVSGSDHSVSPQAKITYSTQRRSVFQLLQDGLNGASPIIYDEVFDEQSRSWRRVRNGMETEAASHRLQAIAERFSLWVFESPARETRVAEVYNNAMNAHVLRVDDGSYLTLPGLAAGLELWPWQRDFVDRAISRPSSFAAHTMGLGKTRTAIATAITLRQFGLANKPAIAVPNNILEQTYREFLQTFPTAKVLLVQREDLTRAGRRLFGARCATGDWDVVLMTHEAFSSIPVPVEVEREWIDRQLSELEDYRRATGDNGKRIAQAVRRLNTQLDRLRGNTNDPDAITFEMLGIDHIGIDEADRFRRLPVVTRAEGFSLGSSKRATDLMLKVSMLRRANPKRPHLALYSGTPFTNTLAEAHVWLQYCAPDRLLDLGMQHFDAWAAQFIRYENVVEVAPDGSGFRSKRRPAVIQNVPELRTLLCGFMSIVRNDTTNLALPEVVQRTVTVAPSQATREYMATLVARADALRQRRVTDLKQDNMLAICGDGRKVALDANLVGYSEPGEKLEAIADEVAATYHANKDRVYPNSPVPGAFQLVCCDLGTPRDGDNQSYGRLRSAMIARGVPATKIRFAHDATTPKAREALFAGCRDGRVAILLGSSAKVGVGANIQVRLIALIHADPTYTPASWEQRNGRIIRTGNLHDTVAITSFVTRTSFDAFMFGIIERKARGFAQLYRTGSDVREIEDLGPTVLTFGELKAAAAGNSLLLRQHELHTEIRKLRLAQMTARHNVRAALVAADEADSDAARFQRRAELLAEVAADRPQLADFDLAGIAHRYLGDRSHYGSRSTRSGVTIELVRDDRKEQLQASSRYRTLWSENLPAKVRRRGAGAVAEWAEAVAGAWLSGLQAEIVRYTDSATRAQQRAGDSRAAAAATDVSQSPELTAAEAELAEVTRRIESEVVTDPGSGTAAAA
jgi:N12 class adenine-specific DNA methylase/SAM-dependent methyltransferase